MHQITLSVELFTEIMSVSFQRHKVYINMMEYLCYAFHFSYLQLSFISGVQDSPNDLIALRHRNQKKYLFQTVTHGGKIQISREKEADTGSSWKAHLVQVLPEPQQLCSHISAYSWSQGCTYHFLSCIFLPQEGAEMPASALSYVFRN